MTTTMMDQHRPLPSRGDRIVQGVLMTAVAALGLQAIIQFVALIIALLRAADATSFPAFAAWTAATFVGFLILYGWEHHIGIH